MQSLSRLTTTLLIGATLVSCPVDNQSRLHQREYTAPKQVNVLRRHEQARAREKHRIKARIDSLNQTKIDAPPTRTMTMDTVHHTAHPVLKDHIHNAYRQAQQFLDKHGIYLETTDTATTSLEYMPAQQFLAANKDWEVDRFPEPAPVKDSAAIRDVLLPPLQAVYDQPAYDNIKEAIKAQTGRLAGSAAELIPKTSLPIKDAFGRNATVRNHIERQERLHNGMYRNRVITDDSLISEIAYESIRTSGWKDPEEPEVYINTDANLTAKVFKNAETPQELRNRLETDLTNTTIHELGHQAGLIHTFHFPNADLDSSRYFIEYKNSGPPNLMSYKRPAYGREKPFSMTDLQVSLWKLNVTEQTQFQQRGLKALSTYYKNRFKDTDPGQYTGADTVVIK